MGLFLRAFPLFTSAKAFRAASSPPFRDALGRKVLLNRSSFRTLRHLRGRSSML